MHMRGQASDHGIGAVLRSLAAFFLSLLPVRYWDRFSACPVSRMVLPSAIVTFVAGVFIQIWNYFIYAGLMTAANVDVFLRAAERQAPLTPPGGHRPGDVTSLHIQAGGIAMPFVTALATPWGLVATYLTLSSLVRGIARIVDDPRGDFLLSGIDALGRGVFGRARRRRHEHARLQAEGPAVPDRAVTGAWLGQPGVDVVVIASRRKPEWLPGVFVLTDDVWYRLGEPFELHLAEGLRTAYPLSMLPTNEIVRRGVRYTMPPVVEAPPPPGPTA